MTATETPRRAVFCSWTGHQRPGFHARRYRPQLYGHADPEAARGVEERFYRNLRAETDIFRRPRRRSHLSHRHQRAAPASSCASSCDQELAEAIGSNAGFARSFWESSAAPALAAITIRRCRGAPAARRSPPRTGRTFSSIFYFGPTRRRHSINAKPNSSAAPACSIRCANSPGNSTVRSASPIAISSTSISPGFAIWKGACRRKRAGCASRSRRSRRSSSARSKGWTPTRRGSNIAATSA